MFLGEQLDKGFSWTLLTSCYQVDHRGNSLFNLRHAIRAHCCPRKAYFSFVHCARLSSEKCPNITLSFKPSNVTLPSVCLWVISGRKFPSAALVLKELSPSSIPALLCTQRFFLFYRLRIRQSGKSPRTIWKIFVYSNIKGLEFNALTKYLILWNVICSVILVYICFEIPNLRFFYVKEYRAQVFLPLIYYKI